MALKLKTPPPIEPVTLVDVKGLLRIDDSDDDTLIASMITAIRQRAEEWTRRSFLTQTLTLWLDEFPHRSGSTMNKLNERVIHIPRPPMQSVIFIKTYDSDNSTVTFDSSMSQLMCCRPLERTLFHHLILYSNILIVQ